MRRKSPYLGGLTGKIFRGLQAAVTLINRQRQDHADLITPYDKRNFIERMFNTLFPTSLLHGTPWLAEWQEKERKENLNIWRIVLTLGAVVYVAHYYLLDRPMGLEPDEVWRNYRFGVAGVLFTAALLTYFNPLANSAFYRLPVYFACWSIAYWQARSMLWYESSLYLYAFAFIVINSSVLRTSMLNSVMFSAFTLATQYPSFLQTDLSRPLLYSASAVTLIFVYITRSSYVDEIRYFVAVQNNISSQKQAIEMNLEFNDRIRALLPREISSRLGYFLSVRGWTVLQAMDEVLTPQKREISCIFSDIRGFTNETKNTEGFLENGVLPNVRACTSVVEQNHGIPRKVGDLVFAYFDDENKYVNLLRCLKAGSQLIRINTQFNDEVDGLSIQRHVLISSGEAVVGNLGGLDSSIEITALGSPVNFLARLDELSKADLLQDILGKQFLLVSNASKLLIDHMGLPIETQKVDLGASGLVIRDFHEEKELWLIPVCDETDFVLDQALSRTSQKTDALKNQLN